MKNSSRFIRSGGTGEPSGKWKKILLISLMTILTLSAAVIVTVTFYWNRMLNLIQDAAETISTVPPVALAAEPEETILPSAPEETLSSVIPEKTITNIMLIGQNKNLADAMILCSVNRETQALTLVSFLRDLYVPIPAYADHAADRNRINTCYYWGTKWTGTAQGGMELLSECLAQNFGIPVDHSIAVDFEVFTQAVDVLGGVDIELTEKEARYLTKHVGYVGEFTPGLQTLNGTEALAYSRIRKIDSDIQRTERQRKVLTALMAKCSTMGLSQLHTLAETVLPMVTTDMTKQEIIGYLWELLPMLKKLEIRCITCPVDNEILSGSRWDRKVEIGGTSCDVIECDIRRNREYLTAFLSLPQERK